MYYLGLERYWCGISFFGNHEEHQELGRLQLEEIDLLDVQVGIHHLV
jgi:hypothetical protein